MERNTQKKIKLTKKMNDFWLNCRGWPPQSAYKLINEARLDRQLSFAKTLPEYSIKFSKDVEDAKIILGYATLRSMSESVIKLFFSVFIEDYYKEPLKNKKTDKEIKPKDIGFDNLIRIYLKHGDSSYKDYLERVQFRGNAIHHFRDRNIGTQCELIEDIQIFLNFLLSVDSQLPYP
ncbi:MAG: hypothetical protein AB7E04_05410 [Desulfobacteraceae bacterium]|jgi:hypothetical protein